MSWRDLLVIVKQAPVTSALARKMVDEANDGEMPWGLTDQLLAGCFDSLRQLLWIQSEDGAKGRNRPRPLPRPGVKPDGDTNQIGTTPIPIADMAALLAARNPNQHK